MAPGDGTGMLPGDGQWPAELGWTSPIGQGKGVFSVLLLHWGFAPQPGGLISPGMDPGHQAPAELCLVVIFFTTLIAA